MVSGLGDFATLASGLENPLSGFIAGQGVTERGHSCPLPGPEQSGAGALLCLQDQVLSIAIGSNR